MMVRQHEQEDMQSANQANFVQEPTSNQSQIISFLKKLQEEVAGLKLDNERRCNPNPNNRSNNYNRKRRRTDKYCWSHGACAHTSKECRASYRKPGHVENATSIMGLRCIAHQ